MRRARGLRSAAGAARLRATGLAQSVCSLLPWELHSHLPHFPAPFPPRMVLEGAFRTVGCQAVAMAMAAGDAVPPLLTPCTEAVLPLSESVGKGGAEHATVWVVVCHSVSQ